MKSTEKEIRRSFWVSLLIGAGIMAATDEIIFHQLLSWHHFYDKATTEIALLSDGILHAAEVLAIVAGFFLFSDLRRRNTLAPITAWAGFFTGMGVFQVFDGIVDHKILRVHQIRYGVDNLFVYDLLWNLSGLFLILIGLGIAIRARKKEIVQNKKSQ